jgi:thiamine-phosphate pyrophosphorylase
MAPRRPSVVRGPAVILRREARSAEPRRTAGHLTTARPPTRLYLITPAIKDARLFASNLEAALGAADVAAVLLHFAGAEARDLRDPVATLAPLIQTRGVALLLDGRPELAAPLGADGAHLTGTDALKRALASLKPERIAGAGGLKTRHDAMVAAESGADYVMFGEPDAAGRRPPFPAVVERVAWWAEVFEPACVGYAASFEEVAELAAAGADFVALDDRVWAGDAAAAVRTAAAAIKPVEALE